ncbi:MAG TPA: hypothetical protein VLT45_26255 [Kofleriaceae bacterium]|nr:hypothetical protein [Kofleriaceae bacterium]
MTRRSVLGVSLLAADVPRDYDALVDAIVTFYTTLGRSPTWFSLHGRRLWGRSRKFRPKAFRDSVLDDDSLMAFLGPEADSATEHVIMCFLRPDDPAKQEFAQRWVTLTATGLTLETPAVRAFVDRMIELYPIVQGAVACYRSLAYAAKECSFSGAVSGDELDDTTRKRLNADQLLEGRFRRRLRRLYPVTIVGPALEKPLPPVPPFESAPRFEQVGDCTLIHAWPALVEPRDPQFLAGTVELRRWLWPYTIQNPADAIEPETT